MLSSSVIARSVLAPLLAASACILPEGSCFAEGTLVETPAGPRRIETLAPGDQVLACNPHTGTTTVRRLTAVLRHELRPTVALDAGGIHLRLTDEHPLWVVHRRAWVHAAEIVPGDVLLVLHEGELRERRVEGVRRDERCVTVYDLSVDGPEHTFFAAGVLVHNKTPRRDVPLDTGAGHYRSDASVVDARVDGASSDSGTGDAESETDAADAAGDAPSLDASVDAAPDTGAVDAGAG